MAQVLKYLAVPLSAVLLLYIVYAISHFMPITSPDETIHIALGASLEVVPGMIAAMRSILYSTSSPGCVVLWCDWVWIS